MYKRKLKAQCPSIEMSNITWCKNVTFFQDIHSDLRRLPLRYAVIKITDILSVICSIFSNRKKNEIISSNVTADKKCSYLAWEHSKRNKFPFRNDWWLGLLLAYVQSCTWLRNYWAFCCNRCWPLLNVKQFSYFYESIWILHLGSASPVVFINQLELMTDTSHAVPCGSPCIVP